MANKFKSTLTVIGRYFLAVILGVSTLVLGGFYIFRAGYSIFYVWTEKLSWIFRSEAFFLSIIPIVFFISIYYCLIKWIVRKRKKYLFRFLIAIFVLNIYYLLPFLFLHFQPFSEDFCSNFGRVCPATCAIDIIIGPMGIDLIHCTNYKDLNNLHFPFF